MNLQTHPATITSITPDGVQTTHYRLEKPILIFSKYHPIDLEKMKEYEASKVVSKVENAFNKKDVKTTIGRENPDVWTVELLKDGFNYYPELKLRMHCQIIETETGCKIVKI